MVDARLLNKNFWLVHLTLVAGAAYSNALAISELVGIRLHPDAATLAAVVRPTPPPMPSPVRKTNVQAILARNVFDHETGSLEATATDEPDSSEPADARTAPRCTGVHALAIAASTDPVWSMALLRSSGHDKSVIRRRGGDVNGKRVQFVGRERVWLEEDAKLCQVSLFDRAPDRPTTDPRPASSQGIRRSGPREFAVDRAVVDRLVEHPEELMRGRISPVVENGQTVGLRLLGVRPDSPLAALGIENGDVLERVNGFDISNPEKALEALARLRLADKLTIALVRKGQNVNIDYDIK